MVLWDIPKKVRVELAAVPSDVSKSLDFSSQLLNREIVFAACIRVL